MAANTLNSLYKRLIDNKINAINNISAIYGGQTEHKLKERQMQHEYEPNSRFLNMVIKPVFSSAKDNQADQINLAETYLILKLREKFGNKCLNIISQCGGGQHHNPGDNHTLYIMYR